MLKSFAHLACALLLVSLLAACDSGAGKSVAVVDLTKVQTTSALVVKVSEHLDAYRGKLMAGALEAEKAFQENETDETRQAYLDAVDGFEKAVAAEEQRIFTTLSGSIDRILAEYREQNGIQAILIKDTVLSYDDSLDITAAVTAALDKVELDLVLPEDASGATPEAAEAAPETDEKPAE